MALRTVSRNEKEWCKGYKMVVSKIRPREVMSFIGEAGEKG